MVLLPSPAGGDRYDHSVSTHGRPVPSLCDWPPLPVQLSQQAEMSSLPGQVDFNFSGPGRSATWMSLTVAVHNHYVGMGSM